MSEAPTEPGHQRPDAFWQEILDARAVAPPPWSSAFPAKLPGGRILFLPIRPLEGTDTAIASLILNQAAFSVQDALADILADALVKYAPDRVGGMPTLGLSLAQAVAQRLGHTRFVPHGTSRKFWYREELSVPLSSITSPDAQKRLYLDPRLTELLRGQNLALIDDAVSTGSSMAAGVELLLKIGVQPTVLGVAMLQTERWQSLSKVAPVVGALRSPLLKRVPGGWDIAGSREKQS